MGKMTDALRKARLLKEQQEAPKGAVPPEAEDVETRPAEPTPVPPSEAEEMPSQPPVETKGPDPAVPTVQTEELPPQAPTEREPEPETTPVLLHIEPQPQPVTPTAPEHEAVLPALEPTPVEAGKPYLSVHYHKDDRTANEFRMLKNQLTTEGSPAGVILVTSCISGEGKTTVAVNLAVSFADTFGERVVLIDGNTRRPKIGELLDLPDQGVCEVLRGHIPPEEAIVKTDIPGLWGLSAGTSGGQSEGLLDPKSIAGLLKRLRRRFTRIVMELPPTGEAPETLALLSQADVALIPVMRSRTRRKDLLQLIEKAESHDAGNLRCVFVKV